MSTKMDTRQSIQRPALSMIGSPISTRLDSILSLTDAELAKLFEDRNVFLTDGGLITFTGTELQFTEDLNLVINQKISGASPQIISLGSVDRAFSATNTMLYAVIDRSLGTAVVTADATTLPAVNGTNQEVFLIAKRIDAGDGVQRIYFRNGTAMDVGQTIRLGASGTGEEGSAPEPMQGYQWREDSAFNIIPTSADSKVNVAYGTNATYSAGDKMWRLSCDKTKTVTVSAGTNLQINLAPSFTVVAGDIVYMTSGARSGQWRRILTVTSQTNFTLDAAFSGGNAAAADTLMVSQAVWIKDLVNFGDPTEENRARDSFAGNIEMIGVDYYDSLTLADIEGDVHRAPRIVLSAANEGVVTDATPPNSNFYSPIYKRKPKPLQIDDYVLNVNTEFGSEVLYLDTFVNAAAGSTTFTMTNAALQTAFAQRLDIPHKHYLTKISLRLSKIGAPVGNLTASIVQDAGGLPIGAVLASASVTVASVPAGPGDVDFVFASTLELPAGNYHVVLQPDATYLGAANVGNHIAPNAVEQYNYDRLQIYNGTTWAPTSVGSYAFRLKLYENSFAAARLFLAWFCNPDNGDVTTDANLISFECSFYAMDFVTNGGTLESAFCYTNGAGDEINCSAPTVVSGKTQIGLDWSYVPNVNPGTTDGQLEVVVNGQTLPRYVSATATTDAYYKEVKNLITDAWDTIELHADLSAFNYSVKVKKSEGIQDSSSVNSTLISTLAGYIVGSGAQVTAGIANYASLQSAIDAAPAQSKITVLNGTYTENITLNKELTIEGSGRGSNVMGTWTFGTSSDYSVINKLRINGDVSFPAGADGIFFRQIFMPASATLSDLGAANSVLVIVE